MIIHKIPVGLLQANCYILVDEETKEAVIIDPGAQSEKIIDVVEKNNLEPKQIILTHTHPDHIGALEEIKSHFKIASKSDFDAIDAMGLEIIKTPGHTPDSICIVADDHIFTGDTLFKSGIGRTDLAGGDYNQIQKSLKRLMEFPGHFKVHPGHGPDTTIAEEKQNNPFFSNP